MKNNKKVYIHSYKSPETYIGFVANDKMFLERCPDCLHENWSMAVSSGVCAWCGFTWSGSENEREWIEKEIKQDE